MRWVDENSFILKRNEKKKTRSLDKVTWEKISQLAKEQKRKTGKKDK